MALYFNFLHLKRAILFTILDTLNTNKTIWVGIIKVIILKLAIQLKTILIMLFQASPITFLTIFVNQVQAA